MKRQVLDTQRPLLQVTLEEDSLTETLTAENTGNAAFEFTAALHTYYSVSAIDKVCFAASEGEILICAITLFTPSELVAGANQGRAGPDVLGQRQ